MKKHWAIFIDNNSSTTKFIRSIKKGNGPEKFSSFYDRKGALLSRITLEKLMEEEERRDRKLIDQENQSLRSMSSGEQRRALIRYIFKSKPDYIILDKPFDNLDKAYQSELKKILETKCNNITYIQLVNRRADVLPFILNYGKLDGNKFTVLNHFEDSSKSKLDTDFIGMIPEPIERITVASDTLVQFMDVNVSYDDKKVLQNINWTVKKNEFWQLMGRNGSGKTTILSMITGDNPKAFGQQIHLFGQKKGSGESVWDIKSKIGYYSPAMTDKFSGSHTLENMLISGLNDSIGLYIRPTEVQQILIKKWLTLLNLTAIKDRLFRDLTVGQKRLVMTARAMVKHPPLLILDEPTAGMDDDSAHLLVSLVNKIASETRTTIIFVSHRTEPGLLPKKIFLLKMTKNGSNGYVKIP
ncbi:ATP-binding cassette domain-containing protein [Maribacter sp. 2210JD10-5]|uniref:ATP-binding cassette domain-containing protein n=1 Tax=Maribacter sp. 2210JD10-5 TaxID=3386272 RepID=UPI0039BD5D65